MSKKAGTVNEGDYYKDNILYCGKCNTPKQCVKDFAGRLVKLNCLCKCEFERKNALKEAYAREKEKQDLEYRRNISIADNKLRACNFDNNKYPDSKLIRYAKKYVDKWDEFYNEGIGMYIFGDVGTGKTFAAACIANALIDKGVSVLMTNFSKIVKGMPDMFDGDQNKYIDDINKNKLLIIDDLGVERSSEYMNEQVYSIVDERYKTGKPTIFTGNLSWNNDILATKEISKKRIYDRIAEMCIPIKADGKTKRKEKLNDKIEKAKKYFEE